ncbi:hypothetical protein Bca52824_028823 [Brassica carinata]|nr:hypothetical protein Bca52824_028823 [Brassica carinata]
MVLPLAMSPPRDNAVPLPVLPEPMMKPRKKLSHQETMFCEQEEEDFKCSAFCLTLRGFGKQKHVRSPKGDDSPIKKKIIKPSSFSNSAVS